MIEQRTTAVEFPFAPAEEEAAVEIECDRQHSSDLLLGRSGTGKTTLLLNRMFTEWCSYHPPHSHQQHTAPVTAEDDDSIVNHIAAPRPFRQIFMTRSAVLTQLVAKSFHALQAGRGHVSTVGGDEYPRFMTRKQFLLWMDSCLPASFFHETRPGARHGWGGGGVDNAMDEKGSLDEYKAQQGLLGRRKRLHEQLAAETGRAQQRYLGEQIEALDAELCRMRPVGADVDAAAGTGTHGQRATPSSSSMVDYRTFVAVLWPKLAHTLPRGSGKTVSPSAIFTEIFSFLLGSSAARAPPTP